MGTPHAMDTLCSHSTLVTMGTHCGCSTPGISHPMPGPMVPSSHLCDHGEVDEAEDDAAECSGELAAQRASSRLGEHVQDARDETLHADKLRQRAGLSGDVPPRAPACARPPCPPCTWLSSPSTRSMKKKSVAQSGDKGISVTALG